MMGIFTKRKLSTNQRLNIGQDLFYELKDMIMEYLDIKTLPSITATVSDNPDVLGIHFMRQYSPLKFNFYVGHRIYSSDTDHDSEYYYHIFTYIDNIYNKFIKNKYIFEIKVIMSYVHELTHYRQALRRDVNYMNRDSYIQPVLEYSTYRSQPIEREARTKASLFVILNFFTLLKVIKKVNKRYGGK